MKMLLLREHCNGFVKSIKAEVILIMLCVGLLVLNRNVPLRYFGTALTPGAAIPGEITIGCLYILLGG